MVLVIAKGTVHALVPFHSRYASPVKRTKERPTERTNPIYLLSVPFNGMGLLYNKRAMALKTSGETMI